MKKTRFFTFLIASFFTLAISAQGIVVHQGNSKQVSFKSKDVQKIEFTESQVENSTDNYVEKSELDGLLDEMRDEINKKLDASEAEELWTKIKSILESIKDLYSIKADKDDYDQQKEEYQKYEKKVDEILNDYLTSADKKELQDNIDKVLKDHDDAITMLTYRVEVNKKDCEQNYEQNKKDIANLAQRVSTLENEVKKINEELSTLNNNLNDKASQSALKELSDLVKELQEKIDSGGGSGDTNMNNGHEYVDLGLSVKWATMNVGATEVAGSKTNSHTGQLDCYGEYYAWGETSPKDEYTWSNLKYCSGSNGNTFTKYVASSSYGTVDNKTTLELTDDAARANWGGSWRMPTTTEQKELSNNCYLEWTTSYNNSGVKGYIVYKVKNDSDKGKKNNTSSYSQTPTASYSLSDTHIFLPASGCRSDSGFDYVDSDGYFLSSSLYAGSSDFAYVLGFHSGGVHWAHLNRQYGQSVRPVCP